MGNPIKRPLFLDHNWYLQLEREVYSWIGTPYKPTWFVKQLGCDCNTFIAGVLYNLGLLKNLEIEYYPNCWWEASNYAEIIQFYIHKHKQYKVSFIDYQIRKYIYNTSYLLPGDILHFSLLGGKKAIINHSAILLQNDVIIHATEQRGVTIGILNQPLLKRLKKYTRIYLLSN